MLVKVAGVKDNFLFFAENAKINLALNKDSIRLSTVTGSASQKDHVLYEQAVKPMNDKLNALSQWSRSKGKMEQSVQDSVTKLWEAIDADRKLAVRQFINQNASSVVAAWAVTRHFLFQPDVQDLEKMYNSLGAQARNSKFGKEINQKLEIENKTAIGRVAPDFSQADTLGRSVALKSFRGKYVLVDFWASWCVPCRQENPNVVKAYDQYKSKNFDIMGVSLDGKKENWIKAIKQDGLMWTHVSDLQDWKNEAAKIYGVNSIPSNFLIDPKGIIIAKNLDGEKLQAKLAEVLK